MAIKRKTSWLPGKRRITHIGFCGGTPEALQHVISLFSDAGIEPIIEGSTHGHDIAVLDADVSRAVTLLRRDIEAERFKITLYES